MSKTETIKYPTLKQVLRANQEKLREWYANLPAIETEEQNNVMALIYKRLCKPGR
jgi:hypothetical protein